MLDDDNNMIDDEWKLKQACDICIADMGKENSKLSEALFWRIAEEFGTVPGANWDYNLVDRVLAEMLESGQW